ncbi:MAG TPA: ABC transporter permease [Actinomycetes bacterium]|jgi:ABC-2 type transport system permease protein|nr:ABC transporter permease [Actinomycetes bacterium]
MTPGPAIPTVRTIGLVAARELRTRLRSRAFQAATAILLLAVVGAIVFPVVLRSDTPTTRRIGLAGAAPQGLPAVLTAQAAATGSRVELHAYPQPAAGEDAVRRSKIDVLLVDGTQLVWRARPDAGLRTLVAGAVQATQARQRAAALGLSDQQLAELLTPARLGERTLARGDPGRAATESVALGMLLLLFMAISFYGAQVLTGVVEEKSTRVVELLLARMPPWQLLAGKVLGIGLLGLGQLALVAAAASITAATVDAVDIPPIGAGLVAWLLVWFLAGFALWSLVYGALGALASRSEDAQTVSAPATVVLSATYFFALFVALSDPEAVTTRIASLVPVTAPLVMPIRLARGQVASWETPLALVLVVVTTYALVRLAGRVYAGALLRTGGKVHLRDAWRLGAASPAPPVTHTRIGT